jgi:hypothetical protein
VHIQTKKFAHEISWDVDQGPKYGPYAPNTDVYEQLTLAPGDHKFNYFDSYGDGWSGGWWEICGGALKTGSCKKPLAGGPKKGLVTSAGGEARFCAGSKCGGAPPPPPMEVDVHLSTKKYAKEIRWNIDGNKAFGVNPPFRDNKDYHELITLPADAMHKIYTIDTSGDGWHGAVWTIKDACGDVLAGGGKKGLVLDAGGETVFWVPYKAKCAKFKVHPAAQYLGCDGIKGSGKLVDVCGVCGGNGKSCLGCDGKPNGAKKDKCGVCGGDGSTCTLYKHNTIKDCGKPTQVFGNRKSLRGVNCGTGAIECAYGHHCRCRPGFRCFGGGLPSPVSGECFASQVCVAGPSITKPPPPPPPPPPTPAPPSVNPYFETVVEPSATSVDKAHTTYTLAIKLKAAAKNVYTIFGEQTSPMILPPAFQMKAPLGANIGGVDPLFFQFKAAARFDSWITIGITQSDRGKMGTIGVKFDFWNEQTGLTVKDGAVFYMDPDSGPGKASTGPKCCTKGGAIVLAQLTVKAGYKGFASMNIGGRSAPTGGRQKGADWRQRSVLFKLGK